MAIFWGIILIIIGAVIVVKSEWLLNNLGRIWFFEQHLGTIGGSRLGYKLIGLIIIFIGFIMVGGLADNVLKGTADFLTPNNNWQQ